MANRFPNERLGRRQFLHRLGAGGAAVAASRLGIPHAKAEGRRGRRPNFIFLLTDDQRADAMGCAGNPIIHTPNMDTLARDGVRFRNAFVTTSICMASRASVFTGLYERKHGCTFGTPPLAPEYWAMGYPSLLRKAGYRTGFIGKFGIRLPKSIKPKDRFDMMVGFPGQGHYERKTEDGRQEHLTSFNGDTALRFLRGCKPDQPFCLSISFKAPHVQDRDPRQFIPDPAYRDLYKDVTIPPPDNGGDKTFERLPAFLQKTEGRERWQIRFATPQMYQRSVKNYYRLVTGVDAQLGRIRAELAKRGLADNTILLLMGDNGFYLGERGLAGKWYAHEESIRVPLLIYDPRKPQAKRGRVLEAMALNVDIAPTLLDLAGLAVPEAMQGRSLAPWLDGQTPAWRQDFLYEHLFDRDNIPKSEGVRTTRWKYVRYFEQKPVYEELYDLQSDPKEHRNLTREPGHQGTLRRLRRRCDELIEARR